MDVRIAVVAAVVCLGAAAQESVLDSSEYDWKLEDRFRLAYSDRRLSDLIDLDHPSTVAEAERRFAEKCSGRPCREATPLNDLFWSRRDRRHIKEVERKDLPGSETEPGTLWVDLIREPVPYRVVVTLQDRERFPDRCEWRLGEQLFASRSCADPFLFPVAASKGPSTVADLHVRPVGSADWESVPIEIRDLLIVGLGDSFASGEGNPDIPAKFHDEKTDCDGHPVRLEDGYAKWVDRKCHRSLYSPQARAAIRFSQMDPHRAVTFLGFACSGAEVPQLIDEPLDGQEEQCLHPDKTGPLCSTAKAYERPEIEQAVAALCEDDHADTKSNRNHADCKGGFVRHVDLVLLSIGGNDAGFAPVLVDLAIEKWWARWATGLLRKRISPEQACERVASNLPALYEKLAAALERRLAVKGRRIVISQYPDVLRDEDGSFCGGVKHSRGLEILQKSASIDQCESGRAYRYLFEPLNRQIAITANRFGWTLVSDHVEQMRKHGWCALATGETLEYPHRTEVGWEPISPNEFPIRSTRQRWLHTPNDVNLLVAQKYSSGFLEAIDDPWETITFVQKGGAFHPSAMADAVVADALVDGMQRALREIPDPPTSPPDTAPICPSGG
jgi:hypothetical protein